MEHSFSAVIKIVGVNPYVEVPEKVSKAFEKKGPIPVDMTINGLPFKATLIPSGSGRHILYLNLLMRNPTNTRVSDKVKITLAYDPVLRQPDVPEELKEALEKENLWEKFQEFSPSHRKEFTNYYIHKKSTESKERALWLIIRYAKKGERLYESSPDSE